MSSIRTTTPRAALGKLLDTFAEHIDEDAYSESKAKAMGYSMKQVVIIASLIEKETDGSDQADIASVIYNRLQKPGETAGLLQIDAALLYGLPGPHRHHYQRGQSGGHAL